MEDVAVSYYRVIPRDLFNEGNLLKMLGRLWLLTEGHDNVEIVHHGEAFRIEQDPGDGAIYAANVQLFINKRRYHLFRPLNSRSEWPLWIRREEDPEFADELVFYVQGDEGEAVLSHEMQQLIEGK